MRAAHRLRPSVGGLVGFARATGRVLGEVQAQPHFAFRHVLGGGDVGDARAAAGGRA